jgi:hypothetical protein
MQMYYLTLKAFDRKLKIIAKHIFKKAQVQTLKSLLETL